MIWRVEIGYRTFDFICESDAMEFARYAKTCANKKDDIYIRLLFKDED